MIWLILGLAPFVIAGLVFLVRDPAGLAFVISFVVIGMGLAWLIAHGIEQLSR